MHYSYTSHTFPNASRKKQLTQSVHKPNKSLSISSRTEAPFDPKTKIQFLLLNSPPRGYAQKALSQLILSTPRTTFPKASPNYNSPSPNYNSPSPSGDTALPGVTAAPRATACLPPEHLPSPAPQRRALRCRRSRHPRAPCPAARRQPALPGTKGPRAFLRGFVLPLSCASSVPYISATPLKGANAGYFLLGYLMAGIERTG